MKKAMINYMQLPKNDELYTPEYAIKPLIKYLKEYSKNNIFYKHEILKNGWGGTVRNMIIWECTDYGSSNITKVLRDNGFTVITTHKKDFDFLKDKPDFGFDMIVTNPPYSLKDEFLEKCYEHDVPFALLLPITALEGIKRGKMYRKHGIELLVFDKRISYMDNGKSSYFNTSWFCKDILPEKLIFEELEKE